MGFGTFGVCALTAIGLLCSALAFGQAYPAKPIRFIVPYAPGGSTSNVARLVAQHLSESVGQPAVVVRLNAEINRILTLVPVRETLLNQGLETYLSTPGQLDALVRSDIDKFAGVVRAANIKLE